MTLSKLAIRTLQALENGENTPFFEILSAETASNADRTGPTWENKTASGLLLVVKIGTLVSTPTFTPKLYTVNPAGVGVLLWTAAAAIAAAATAVYWLGPGAATAGAITEGAIIAIPRDLYLFLDYTGTAGSMNAPTQAWAAHLIG